MEFLLFVIWNLIWPPKGIIYIEEQIYQWIYVFGKLWLINNGWIVIMIVAIYVLIVYVAFERPYRNGTAGRILTEFIRFLARILGVILFSWAMLIYGAVYGDNGERGEREARINYTLRRTPVLGRRFLTITQNLARLSLHFRLGRWLFRSFYRLLGRIPYFREGSNERARVILSRVLAMVIILWGVWNIPHDLMT